MALNGRSSASPSLVFAAYFGGNGDDSVRSLKQFGQRIFFTGTTTSQDLPTSVHADRAVACTLDAKGDNVYFAGSTSSTNFPVTPGALERAPGSTLPDGFVTRISMTTAGPTLAAYQNAGSFLQTGIAPGLFIVLYGTGIGPAGSPVGASLDANGRVANVTIPAGARSGNVPVVVTVGVARSADGVTVAIK